MASDGGSGLYPFEEVLRQELQQIAISRLARLGAGKEETARTDQALVGLALSGGGIRSATFGLGVLQGLASSGLLSRLDYLSSTGGGSYITGFLSTWIRYSGYQDVENRLGGGKSSTESPEIQELRQSTVSILGRGSSSAVLTWLRNLAFNLVSIAALLGACFLLADLALNWIFRLDLVPTLQASLFGGTAAILLAILSRRTEQSLLSHPARQWRSLTIVSTIAACALLSVVMAGMAGSSSRLDIWLKTGCAIASYCVLAWLPRKATLMTLLAHLASAAAAGVAGGFLLYFLSRWFSGHPDVAMIELTTPPIVVSVVVAVLFYMFLMGAWISKKVRELCGWLCRSLLYISAVWLMVALIWRLTQTSLSALFVLGALIIAVVFIVGGLLSSVGALAMRRSLPVVFDLLERIAPFLFVLALAAAIAAPLTPLAQQTSQAQLLIETTVAAGLLVIGLFLLRHMAANEFTMHGFQRARVARSYLASAVVGARERTGRIDEDKVRLGDLVGLPGQAGPYPLFGAALGGVEVDSFVFSPLFSGFDPVRTRDKEASLIGAYRQTAKFSAGVSAATAMAISGPLRENPLQPASAAIAMLWTIFDLRDGRWMGNPLREDAWYRSGPRIGAAYALREGFTKLDNEEAFVRPSGGFAFDNLGIYQLVKRRCLFIIACDASTDPTYTFPALSLAIRRCRTELGVEIEMDLGPLGRRGSTAGAHCQIAVIHYPAREPGLMLYIKPSLTGDESADLLQYAVAHPDFPAADAVPGSFDEADFELYRRLGQHIVESLFAQVGPSEKLAEMPVEQIFRAIRRRLQPDFKEAETASELPTAQPPEAPSAELVDTIASRECVLCAGPGLAAQAKAPTWPSFLEGLLRVAREAGVLDAATAAGLAATLGAGELEAVADELTHQVPRDLLLGYVHSATSASEPSLAHQLLAKMPFLGALNTSFDDLLAAVFDSRLLVPAQTEDLIKALYSKSFFVANVLGSVSQPSSLVFTLKELRMLLAENLHFKQFLSTIFLRYNVLFVGSSVDGLRAYLEALELPKTPERRHYALVANSGLLDPVKLRFLERSYNLHVIEYQPQFNFAGLSAFLEQLQSAVSEKTPLTKPAGSKVLKSVALENIGPFESLHLKLTPTWNLLLGDNGVGKTVVLRAIAAALCGDKADAQTVARLLRSGADSGSILLTDEGREYKVELKRDTDGNVHIAAASLSPIKYDKWLVLGFPALRSIPWGRPKGPSAPRPEAPSADDLLPILRSEPDQRIADIKQWLINLDYAASSEPQPSQSRELLDGFFEVLQQLTPDMRIKLHSIDKKTMEITIETDSGLVPLEAISQGTGSVMCWIGTLLERLSEAGSEGAALVLIDEIDAHMHPKWQQLFVGAFRDRFKEVQVIATTHSPLLVGSLRPEEIWLVHRAPLRSEIYGVVHLEKADDGGRQEIVIFGPEDEPEEGQPSAPREERRYRLPVSAQLLVKEGEIVEEREPLATELVVVAERLQFGPEGLRVDQILTGPLFNLETTRDPETSALMNEYSSLVALDNPNEEDQKRLAEVAGQLQVRTVTPQEKEVARRAYGIIQDFATERLKSLPPEERQKVLDEVKVQLTETVTGSRRPA